MATGNIVEETTEIDAPPEGVWAAIAGFHDLSWLPPVDTTDGPGGNAIGATRRITLKGGAIIDEVLTDYAHEGMTYSYRITATDLTVMPVSNYDSTIAVTPAGESRSQVLWRGTFDRGHPGDNPPPELNDEAAIKAVSGLYRVGLGALKAKFENGA